LTLKYERDIDFKVVVNKQASIDLLTSANWYDKQQPNLGLKFYDDYRETRKYLHLNPFLFQKRSRRFYEAKLSVFPFLIIYEILDDIVIIHAVFNTSKNPGKKPTRF
jgi:hypothetical protein